MMSNSDETFVGMEPVKVCCNGKYGATVLLADGSVYQTEDAGYNGSATWTELAFGEPVTDMTTEGLYLAESGNLYVLVDGVPTLIARNVTQIMDSYFISNGQGGKYADGEANIFDAAWDYDLFNETAARYITSVYGIRDDVIYRPGTAAGETESVYFDGLDNILAFDGYKTEVGNNIVLYIGTSDGLLYQLTNNQLAVFSLTAMEGDALWLTGTNLSGGNLTEDALELTFSNMLTHGAVTLYEGTAAISAHAEISGNRLTVTSNLGMQEGKTYRLVIDTDELIADGGAALAETLEVSFVYNPSGVTETLELPDEVITMTMDAPVGELPEVQFTEGAAIGLQWTSSDTSVAEILEGKLVANANGRAVLTVTDRKSGLSDSIVVLVGDAANLPIHLTGTNLVKNRLAADALELEFDCMLAAAEPVLYKDGTEIAAQAETALTKLTIRPEEAFAADGVYQLVLPANQLSGSNAEQLTEDLRISFVLAREEEPDVVRPSQTDESVVRGVAAFEEKLQQLIEEVRMNYSFYGNAVLNRLSTDTDATHWLRPQAPTASTYTEIYLAGNYWGTDNADIVEMQILDYLDSPTYARLLTSPFLTEAPENTYPFATSVTLLNKNGETVNTVGGEEITFRITFNRDMDTTIPLQVFFGSAYPYADHTVEGAYTDARTWSGTYHFGSTMENGNQYLLISNGCSAADDLQLQPDSARFGFAIDTTAAQALIMQGVATETGIRLSWTQDDFETLMGYNVYRSTAEDGLYTRLNETTIPAEEKTFFDANVEPGVVYYYNFTVVKTNLTESEPSGKIRIMSMDTMAPDIYHSGVATGIAGRNLVISATVTDNLSISYAELKYRTVGEETWKTIRMNNLNDKYSAIIPHSDVTAAGVEYYLMAFDGISYTYKGTEEAPFTVLVQESVAAGDMGDVNMDGKITMLDAMMVLYAINDKYNMNEEEFLRADLDGNGTLEAREALRILQYANGSVGSVDLSG